MTPEEWVDSVGQWVDGTRVEVIRMVTAAIAAERERCAKIEKERDALKQAILDGVNCCHCEYDEHGVAVGPCELHERIARLEAALTRVAECEYVTPLADARLMRHIATEALK